MPSLFSFGFHLGGKKQKGKKQKRKTVPLNAFLSNDAPTGGSSVVYAAKSTSWADESEDLSVHGKSSDYFCPIGGGWELWFASWRTCAKIIYTLHGNVNDGVFKIC